MNLPEGTIVTTRRKKTVCKNKPHAWETVYRYTEIWPFEVPLFQICLRCGRKDKRTSGLSV